MELRCENLSKRFGPIVALNRVSINVQEGEIRALLGGNGSGKSTLAKIIGGIYYPTEGKIAFGNDDFTKTSPRLQKKRKVIITSQELSLFPNLSVAENLNITNIPTRAGFSDYNEMEMRALEVLKKIKFEDLLEEKVAHLAPNQKYMLEFAKALLQDPKILVVDEITSALFRNDVEIIKGIFTELKSKGAIILFISHRMSEIFNLCDSVSVMRNGEIIGTFGIHEKGEAELLSMMVGKQVSKHSESSTAAIDAMHEELLSLNSFPLPGFGTQINLKVNKGEIVGIAGLQGHGQSVLIRAIAGLYGPVDINFDGKACRISNSRAAVHKGIAFISGDRTKEGAFLERSVEENVMAVSSIVLGQKKKSAENILNRVSVVYSSVAQKIQELSGGNQQKVILGRWISTEPKLFLADDPTKGIDVQARRDIHKLLCELADNGASIIMFSSDDEELVSLTKLARHSKVLVMYEGTIAAELKGRDIAVHNIIENSLQRRGEHL